MLKTATPKVLALTLAILFAASGCGGDDAPDQNGDDVNDAGTNADGTDTDEPDDNQPDDNNGDPSDDPYCLESMSEEDACGGALIGQWDNDTICTDFDADQIFEELDCPEAQVERFDYRVADGSGSLEFTDEQMDHDMVIVIDLDFYVPEECLELEAFTIDCPTFAGSIETFLGMQAECTETDDSSNGQTGCDCITEDGEIDQSWSGEYEADSDEGIISIDDDGTEIDYFYCVDDEVLNFRETGEVIELPMTGSYTAGP